MRKSLTALFVLITCLSISYSQEDMQDISFGKYRILHSDILEQDRVLYIHLPENYESSDESYPVVFQLYAHFMESYYLPAIRTTSIMGGSSLAPNMIVVGVMNREFRYRDLLPVDHWGGKSEIDNFVNFFENELIPFVESNYRTKDYRVLSGPQAGAAFGIYTLSKKPELFDAYFLSSPLWIKAARSPLLEMFEAAVEKNDFSNKFLMITYGKYEAGKELESIQQFNQLAQSINTETFTFHINKIDENFGFSTPVDFETGMKQLFNDFKFPGKDKPQELEIIEDHFHMVSEKLGYEVKITEHALVFEGDKFVRDKEYEKALVLFQKMHELYPEGLMGFDRLGSVYYYLDKPELSIKYYNMFLEKQPGNPRITGIIEQIKSEHNID